MNDNQKYYKDAFDFYQTKMLDKIDIGSSIEWRGSIGKVVGFYILGTGLQREYYSKSLKFITESIKAHFSLPNSVFGTVLKWNEQNILLWSRFSLEGQIDHSS